MTLSPWPPRLESSEQSRKLNQIVPKGELYGCSTSIEILAGPVVAAAVAGSATVATVSQPVAVVAAAGNREATTEGLRTQVTVIGSLRCQ